MASSPVWMPFRMIGMLVQLLIQGRSFQFRDGSMKDEMARVVPWFVGILSFCFVCTFAESLALLRMSRSRLPRRGASTVTNKALKPSFSAFCTTDFVSSLSRFTYSCDHLIHGAAGKRGAELWDTCHVGSPCQAALAI